MAGSMELRWQVDQVLFDASNEACSDVVIVGKTEEDQTNNAGLGIHTTYHCFCDLIHDALM